MKQRSKILTALFLSASLAVTPAASVSVLAEDLDFAAVEEIDVVPEEEISDSEEVSTSTEDSVLAADITTEDSDLTTDEFTADTSTFSADEADVFTSGETSEPGCLRSQNSFYQSFCYQQFRGCFRHVRYGQCCCHQTGRWHLSGKNAPDKRKQKLHGSHR